MWQLHRRPELTAKAPDGSQVKIDLSGYNYESLHQTFSKHFKRSPPKATHQQLWRKFTMNAYDSGVGGSGVILVLTLLAICCAGGVCFTICLGFRDICSDELDYHR